MSTRQDARGGREGEPFVGPGEMRALCHAFDWSRTSLGPVSGWSHSLRTTASIVLGSRNPMFLWWGPDLVQLYNDAYRPSLGESSRHPHALGMRAADCWTDIWSVISPQIEQVMTTGEATWHEDQYLPIERNGRLEDVWWTYSYSAVRDDDGSIGGTLVVCLETTQRVLTERERERLLEETARAEIALLESEARYRAEREQLRSLIVHMPAPVALLAGPEHRHEIVNDAYRRVSGGGRDVTGLTPREAFPERAGQGIHELFDRVYESGEPWIGRETPICYDRDGTGDLDTWFDLRLEPVRDPKGRVFAIISFAVDVTEQVRARREVESLLKESEHARRDAELARAEAEKASRARGDFLAVMSHELRTPLNAIGGYAELMEMGLRGPITEEQRIDLARIQQSQKHLLGLINQVLNYTRIETGTVRYQLADVPVVQALAAAEALVVPQVRARGLTYVLGGCDPALRVRADRDKLQQILLNLLTNAIKFTDAGGEIRVSCAAPRDVVALTVADTGIGIAADKLATVFEPFVQVDQRLTRPHEGVGLGLAISRDLARGMGGELTAESTLGLGSTFALVLPRVPSTEAA